MSRYKLALFLVFILAVVLSAGIYVQLKKDLGAQNTSGQNPVVTITKAKTSVINETFTPTETSPPSEEIPSEYNIVKVIRGPAIRSISEIGMVRYAREASLASKRGGKVIEVIVNSGDRVGPRVPLAKINCPEEEQDVAVKWEMVKLVRKDYAQTRRKYGQKEISKEEYEKAANEFEKAISDHKKAETALGECSITAPYSGTILWKDIEVGDTIQEGQEAFRIGDQEPLQVVVTLPAEKTGGISRKSSAFIIQGKSLDEFILGKIHGKYEKPDTNGQEYEIKIDLDRRAKIMAGEELETYIVTTLMKGALLIPKSSVVQKDGNSFVYIAKPVSEENGYKIQKSPISLGEGGEFTYRVTDEELILDDDLIIANPSLNLKAGDIIQASIIEPPLDNAQKILMSEKLNCSNNQDGGCGSTSSSSGECGNTDTSAALSPSTYSQSQQVYPQSTPPPLP